MPSRLQETVHVITGMGGSMSRASVLAPAREGALVDGCDLSVDEAPATVELVRDGGGEMVSKHPHHPTEPGRLPRTGCLTLGSVGPVDVLFNLASTSYSTGSRTSPKKRGIAPTATRSTPPGGMKIW